MGTNGELWLPEPAIERIQDFLDSKEAAQTMILSKSWYNVWLFRPNLDFNHSHNYYGYESYDQEVKRFYEFVDKSLSRYEESNLKIDSFRLSIGNCESSEFIVRALKIGASHFTLFLRDSSDFVLPDEVFESAQDLTLIRCCINPRPLVTCNSRLQSLRLSQIEFENPDAISIILSSCPLIQKITLYYISMVKPLDFIPSSDGAGYYDNYPTDDTGYITKPLMWLTTLKLEHVYFDMLFLGDLSSKFPMLKHLTLIMTLKKYQEEIRISSNSLERLKFTLKNSFTHTRYNHPYKRQRVTLDFPSIRKFTYKSSVIPLLSLESNSRGWESRLYVRRRVKPLTTSWFRRMGDFLTKLKRSRVSLSLRVRSVKSFNYEAGDIQGFLTTEIENLIIDYQELTSSLTCYALLDGLFRICHPKLITPCVSYCFCCVKKTHIELLGQILLNRVQMDHHEKNTLTRSQFMYGLNDLKEARAQIIDDNEADVTFSCRDVSLEALLEHLKSAKGKQEVRFQLSWQPTTTTRKKFYMKMCNQKIQEFDNNRVVNPDSQKGLSTIEFAKSCNVVTVCQTILKNSNSGELVIKIKQLLKLLHGGFPESDNVHDANEFSCMLYEVFREPCFVNAFRAAIEERYYSSIDFCAELLSNEYSSTERVAHMTADWRFKHTLMSLRYDNTCFKTIRVFLNILFGHWSDEDELRELDKRLGKYHFGRKFDDMKARVKFSPLERRNAMRY